MSDEKSPLINGDYESAGAVVKVISPPEQKTRFEIFLVVMPLFCGYACLFALQHSVKSVYGITDNGSDESYYFGMAASLVYIGNCVFRLGHNVLFAPFEPKTRVIISMFSMFISMGMIVCIFFVFTKPSLVWVFLAYGFGGTGIGTFESNLLSTITPLGKQTKFWALIAIPTGIVSITVGGFIVIQLGVHPGLIYAAVGIYLAVGLVVYITRFYFLPSSSVNAVNFMEFLSQMKEARNWIGQIKWHSLALMIDMFCVSMFAPGVMLYIYDQPSVNFHYFSMPTAWLFVIYDSGVFIGDTLSRRIFYPIRVIFPFVFLTLAVVGVACALSNVALLAPFAGFFIAFCNGAIYSQANRQIDATVPSKYNLIAFSFWLFVGDIGSVIGSNSITAVTKSVKHLYGIQ